MSKISKAVSQVNEANSLRLDETTKNFMGGDSYILTPITTLKMITASSIFGEAAYYRNSSLSRKKYAINEYVESILPEEYTDNKTTEEVMLKSIDDALDYDFDATLNWAVQLRHNYNIRLNPQVIAIRAAMHPKRCEFTSTFPGKFAEYNKKIMHRADEPMTQIALWIYFNGKKNSIPTILKKTWAAKLNSLSKYQVAKYKAAEIGMINAVRICHAHSEIIDELMKTGTISIETYEKTWENLRSEGKPWKEIYETIDMGHMAMLRNLRGIFTEIDDIEFCKEYLKDLKDGVENGRQLPFRYYSAYNAVKGSDDINHKALILDALEECIDIAMKNYPKLKGKTACLSDNSGSAWGTLNSEFGSVKIAHIDNLSSVMTAFNSDEGEVVKFGDTIRRFDIQKRNGVLSQALAVNEDLYDDVGGHTEGGIWEFFRDAMKNKTKYDNIFIYSDQQAGHGGLYGTSEQTMEYGDKYGCNGYSREYINVFKLVQDYRKYVNPKVNVFSVQTAGYNNNVLPEYAYRTAILYGWTGREAEFAQVMIDIWDDVENNKQTN